MRPPFLSRLDRATAAAGTSPPAPHAPFFLPKCPIFSVGASGCCWCFQVNSQGRTQAAEETMAPVAILLCPQAIFPACWCHGVLVTLSSCAANGKTPVGCAHHLTAEKRCLLVQSVGTGFLTSLFQSLWCAAAAALQTFCNALWPGVSHSHATTSWSNCMASVWTVPSRSCCLLVTTRSVSPLTLSAHKVACYPAASAARRHWLVGKAKQPCITCLLSPL